MNNSRFTKWFILCVLLISGVVSSCQKDDSVKAMDNTKEVAAADSASLGIINTPGNFLASKGILKITIEDSTYSFDAATDSIAFINVHNGDNKYFGITAINKAHTMSFGISSEGFAVANANSKVAGGQFLFTVGERKPLLQYTLTRFVGKDDTGKITLEKYNNQNIIAKGTFFTFLAKDDKESSPFYRVEGSFELQLK
ncbi:hypothetical protein [Mucilaginibacter sp. FT3.2]|uniref:hypothetical protein n=1 Tax=Mucilaginibacter sp. FT3.2 TaxID=2723090 RepID=UPI00161FB6C9|nr:hypothetical protein [Mucilaginibacter sp. FT3.2]MBB6233265.1 hypothetical protein [Mucilaginibacter sp. FT3.2]